MALFSTLLLAAAALAIVIVVARTRGRASPLDILVPVLLLNWGHYMNLLWGFQLFYTLPTTLACGLLLLLSANRSQLSVARAFAVGTCSIAAALCGGSGVFFLPAATVWLAYAGAQRWRDNRFASGGIIVLAAATLLPLKLWLASLPTLQSAAPADKLALGTVLHGALQFLSMSLGKFGGETHPAGGLIVAVLAAVAIVRLCREWRRSPDQRLRTAGLGLFLAATLAMALGVGLTRGSIGCLQNRYSLLGCPMIVCIYLVGTFYGPRLRPARVRWAGFAALLVLAVLYDAKGQRLASDMRWCVLRMEESVRDGLPAEAVGARHWEDMQSASAEVLARDLQRMRAAGIGPYRAGIPPATSRDVVVAPLLALEPPRAATEMKRLGSQEQLVQRFFASSDRPLCRIDLEAYPFRTSAGRLHWAIDEIDADGGRRIEAEGESALNAWPDPGYARLIVRPLAARTARQLELRLWLDGAAAAQLRVPRYRLAADAAEHGVRAFAYYERELR